VFPAGQQNQVRTQFSETLMAVLSQTLFKRKDGSGRIAALEIMIGTAAIRNLIRENKISQIPSAIQTGQKFGMQTMEAAIKDLITRRAINPEEAEGFLNTNGT
jgi:twitching motility protein PilT